MKIGIYLTILFLIFIAGCSYYPKVSIAGPIEVNSTNLTVSFTATDNRATILTYTLYIDDVQVDTGSIQTGVEIQKDITIQDKESSIFKVKVTDQFGNNGYDQITITYRDNIAPSVSILKITVR